MAGVQSCDIPICGDEIGAVGRVRASEEAESGGGRHPLAKKRLGHGQLVEVCEQTEVLAWQWYFRCGHRIRYQVDGYS